MSSSSSTIIPLIVTVTILRSLSRSVQISAALPGWKIFFKRGILAAVGLFVIQLVTRLSSIIFWLWHILLLTLIWFVLKKKELQGGRLTIIAVLPLEAVALLSGLIRMVLKTEQYQSINDYVESAVLFAFLWAVVLLIYTKTQQKKKDVEFLERKREEELYKITEIQKAALEVTVAERTVELTQQKEALQKSLTELKSAQSQLIQSEKMASLGELTAGIAHEIQNPLNFVNNFSEVSAELLDEMEEEMDKQNHAEVKQLAEDVRQNLQKIIQHGKRADAIVKGMLQHSRVNSGQKELTDVNALADEYLRLSYHGLRAKDKNFNATLETDFDQSIDKINIIPQDIGRVLLNLYNNAFYAVAKKSATHQPPPTGGEVYIPTVSVSTKKVHIPFGSEGWTGAAPEVEIRVKDNGNGIPQTIIDKIFQPFFTTKPTGEGTGLGLSLSYDIITKGHYGSIDVTSEEGEWTEFVIKIPVVQSQLTVL